MQGALRTLADQWRMQAEHVAPRDQLIQAVEVALLRRLTRRIADQYLPAQSAQHLGEAAADLTGADDAIGPLRQLRAGAIGQRQQHAKHPVHHPTGIAAGGVAPADARLLQIAEIEMVGAYGAGTNEADLRTCQQRLVDAGDGAHQQRIGAAHGFAIEGAARKAFEGRMGSEKGVQQRYVFVGKDVHAWALARAGIGTLAGHSHQATVAARLATPAMRSRLLAPKLTDRSSDLLSASYQT